MFHTLYATFLWINRMCYYFFFLVNIQFIIYYYLFIVCVCVNVLLHNLFHDIIFLKFVFFFSIWHIYIISVNRKINDKILIQLTCNQNNQHCNKFILLRPDIRVYTVVWTSLNKLINLLLIHVYPFNIPIFVFLQLMWITVGACVFTVRNYYTPLCTFLILH